MIPDKRRYNVGVRKIPHRDRDVAHRVLGGNEDRRFFDIIGADTHDDDDEFPVGSNCTYAVDLTPDEAQEFSEASNCRYVEADTKTYPITAPGPNLLSPNGIPTDRTLTYMGCNFPTFPNWHGRDVKFCVMDQGTNALVRSKLGINLIGRGIFGDVPQDELFPDVTHGCLVAGNLVPAGGQILDAMIIDSAGHSSAAMFSAGLRWACQNGAQVVNYSFGGGATNQAYADAITYMGNFNTVLCIAAGNDSRGSLSVPASYVTSFTDRMAALIAFDERTNGKASFSNYSQFATGCAPGVLVLSVQRDGLAVEWSGTSAASPNAGNVLGRIQTGGTATAKQALALARQKLRDTGQPQLLQGGGAFDLSRAVIPVGGGDPGDPTVPPFQTRSNALLAVL